MNLASFDEVDFRRRTGQRIAVFVEGDSDREDPYFYRRWFGSESLTFAFFPGDGWREVIRIVEQLRQHLPDVPIYGIIDRDFAEDDEVQAFNDDFPQSHVLKMPRFTLENYLLDAECWYQTLKLVFPRDETPPAGWESPDAVAQQIQQAFNECLPLAAHNWVVRFGDDKYNQPVVKLLKRYLKHPKALQGYDPPTELAQWGQAIGASEDFAVLYQERLQRLQAMSMDELEQFVSGEYVLNAMHDRFPLRPGKVKGQFDLDHYLDLYLDRCPDPHNDLKELLQKIRVTVGR